MEYFIIFLFEISICGLCPLKEIFGFSDFLILEF